MGGRHSQAWGSSVDATWLEMMPSVLHVVLVCKPEPYIRYLFWLELHTVQHRECWTVTMPKPLKVAWAQRELPPLVKERTARHLVCEHRMITARATTQCPLLMTHTWSLKQLYIDWLTFLLKICNISSTKLFNKLSHFKFRFNGLFDRENQPCESGVFLIKGNVTYLYMSHLCSFIPLLWIVSVWRTFICYTSVVFSLKVRPYAFSLSCKQDVSPACSRLL